MNQIEFLLHLRRFVNDHGISDDLPSRKLKLQEEVRELCEAIDSGIISDIIKEACDVTIICFHIMLICGVHDPLHHCFFKLEEVAARQSYKKRRADIKRAVS